MCRIFGFRSVLQSGVHRSLMSADNALALQSERHPDGWGVAYYAAGAPHLLRSVQTAMSDQLFRHVSGIVTSETVLAHLRKATQGEMNVLDTHPFQFGTWTFAHNGNVSNFPALRAALVDRVPPVLRRFILGQTDSEVVFYILLGKMAARYDLEQRGYPLDALADAARETIAEVTALAGALHPHDAGPPTENYLTFVVTNGRTMLAHQGGKALNYSVHKQRCSERDTCAYFQQECERFTDKGFVSHLVLSSEPLHGENVWNPMPLGEMVGVDWRMHMQRFSP
jgi:glutamine amidotransferase